MTDFAAYVEASQQTLLRSAYLLTGNWSAAEDIVQTTYSRLWPGWSRVSQHENVDAYVRRTLINAFLSQARRRASREVVVEEVPERISPHSDGVDAGRPDLLRAIADLTPRQRAVLALRFYEDLTEAQTAAALGCSVGTVKSLSARAFVTLRNDPRVRGLLEENGDA